MKHGLTGTLLALFAAVVTSLPVAAAPLPEGGGLAASYPSDVGISADSNVVWADNFESYSSVSNITSAYNGVNSSSYMSLTTASGNYYAGSKGLAINFPSGSNEIASYLIKSVNNLDTVFVRMYTKFGSGYVFDGSSHNNIDVQGKYCCPGVPADGTNKINVSLDTLRASYAYPSVASPGDMTVYVYYPDQRSAYGDYWYPDGRVLPYTSTPYDFGNDFVARPDFVPKLNQWYSFELMVKLNTPGQRDGRVAIWADGRIIADWQNLLFRTVSTLHLDSVHITFHTNGTRTVPLAKYYDNIVIAKSYIGPMSSGGTTVPMPPTNVQVSGN